MGAAGFWFGSGSDIWSGLGCESEVKTASVIVSVAESESLIAVVGARPCVWIIGTAWVGEHPRLSPIAPGAWIRHGLLRVRAGRHRRCSNGGGALG